MQEGVGGSLRCTGGCLFIYICGIGTGLLVAGLGEAVHGIWAGQGTHDADMQRRHWVSSAISDVMVGLIVSAVGVVGVIGG